MSAVATARFPATAKARLSRELSQAWQITRGQGVTIAVLSTAVDAVSGLAGKVTQGPDYAPLAGAPAIDGTILASLIAGSGPTGTDPFGPIGRAPGARILAERIVNYGVGKRDQSFQQDGTWQGLAAKAIRYAVNHGASVIVMDEGGSTDSLALASAVHYAVARNVVVIGSMYVTSGHPSPPAYPDSLPGVINPTGVPVSGLPPPQSRVFMPVNSSILVAAPDNTLPATGPGNVPYTAWGPFSATAWVAGTAALIKAVYPHITPARVARALAESASYHPPGGYNTTVGFGLINPIGALHDAGALVRLGTGTTAAQSAVSRGATFGASKPAAIDAVHHATAKLAGSAAAIVVGAVLLILTVILVRRRRQAGLERGQAG
jgi:hypothetical protein